MITCEGYGDGRMSTCEGYIGESTCEGYRDDIRVPVRGTYGIVVILKL